MSSIPEVHQVIDTENQASGLVKELMTSALQRDPQANVFIVVAKKTHEDEDRSDYMTSARYVSQTSYGQFSVMTTILTMLSEQKLPMFFQLAMAYMFFLRLQTMPSPLWVGVFTLVNAAVAVLLARDLWAHEFHFVTIAALITWLLLALRVLAPRRQKD